MEVLTQLWDIGVAGAVSIAVVILYVAVALADWNIFRKAGVAGWKSFVPFYNLYLMFVIAELPGWFAAPAYLTAFLGVWAQVATVPAWLTVVGGLTGMMTFVFNIAKAFKLAEVFDRGIVYILGLIFLPSIFELLLAYGPARYVGHYSDHQS